MSGQLASYLYAEIPAMPPAWTLAVLATSRKDANVYVKAVWRGGKFLRSQTEGKVDAHCGSVTDAAQEILHQRVEAEYTEYKRQREASE